MRRKEYRPNLMTIDRDWEVKIPIWSSQLISVPIKFLKHLVHFRSGSKGFLEAIILSMTHPGM